MEFIKTAKMMTVEEVDNYAVDLLAQRMKAKLAKKRMQGYEGWLDCPPEHLSKLLQEHVIKGDPVDVANFCAFLSARELSTTNKEADSE